MILYSLYGGEKKYPGQPDLKGAAESINLFQETNGEDTYQTSCPGIKKLGINLGSTIHGSFTPSVGLASNGYKPDLFVAAGNKIYRIDTSNTAYEIGTCSTNEVRFAESGGETPILLWVDGYTIGGYNLKTGSKVEITLPKRITDNLYIKPTHIAVVSGSIIVNDSNSGYVYYSNPYPLSNTTRTVFDVQDGVVQYEDDGITVKEITVNSGVYCFLDNYGTQQYFNAESSSDKVIAINSVGSLLTLYGPGSIEFWQKGNSESYQTWQRTSYTINKEQGLEAPYSLASVNNIQFCIGTGKSTARCILMITGTNVQKISEPWLDEILNNTDTKTITGFTYSYKGHSFYGINLVDKAIVYDVTTGLWHIRQSRNPYNGELTKYLIKDTMFFNNKIIGMSSKDGMLYELTDKYYCEDWDNEKTYPLIRIRQTPVISSNNKDFIITQIAIETNVGTVQSYTYSDFITNEKHQYKPKALLQVSKDGGATFGNTIESSLGVRGDYTHRLKWLNLGMLRRCVLRIICSEDQPFTITNADIQYKECGTQI